MESLYPWLVRARAEVAELKGMSSLLIGREHLLKPLLLVEAIGQCEMDGHRMAFQEILESQLYTAPEQTPVAREVFRTREALQSFIQTNPVHGSLLEELAALESVCLGRTPGKKQPKPHFVSGQSTASGKGNQLPAQIAEAQRFMETENRELDPLVKSLMILWQLEAIEAFEDRNSRISRIHFKGHLVRIGLLRFPVIFLSGFLQRNLANHQRLRREVSGRDGWCPYLKFMLHGLYQRASQTRLKIESLLEYQDQFDQKVSELCKALYTPELIKVLMTYPVISPLRLSARMNIHYTTATRYLKKLEEEGFMANRQSGKYQLYTNHQLVQLLSEYDSTPENGGFD